MKLSYDSIAVKLGGKQILRSVSLATRPGEIVGIVGANGCGKSTLIKTTFGAVQKQQGTISLDGKPVTAYSPRELASILGYVGQDSECTFDFTVREVVSMGLFARKNPKSRLFRLPWRNWGLPRWQSGIFKACPAASGRWCSLPVPLPRGRTP